MSAKKWASSWVTMNPDAQYMLYDDHMAEKFMRTNFSGRIFEAYTSMPPGVLRADYFRYAVVLVHGGVYSDIDTTCLRPISSWTTGYEGVRLIVGIENDKLPNLRMSFRRELQLLQWTFAAAPGHPVLRKVVDRIASISLDFPNKPRPRVMDWTGPSLWTDIVWDHVKQTYNVDSNEFTQLKVPKQVGDILVLPITGFSPGVHNAEPTYSPQAKVQHHFKGSWKRR